MGWYPGPWVPGLIVDALFLFAVKLGGCSWFQLCRANLDIAIATTPPARFTMNAENDPLAALGFGVSVK